MEILISTMFCHQPKAQRNLLLHNLTLSLLVTKSAVIRLQIQNQTMTLMMKLDHLVSFRQSIKKGSLISRTIQLSIHSTKIELLNVLTKCFLIFFMILIRRRPTVFYQRNKNRGFVKHMKNP